MGQVAIRTPSGRVVAVDENSLGLVAELICDARLKVFDDVIGVLDRDHTRFKDCGDNASAEVIEVLRAKIRAKRDL